MIYKFAIKSYSNLVEPVKAIPFVPQEPDKIQMYATMLESIVKANSITIYTCIMLIEAAIVYPIATPNKFTY